MESGTQKERVKELLNNACENGYEIEMRTLWDANMVALDLKDCVKEMEEVNVGVLIPIIEEWRKDKKNGT